MFLNKDNKVIRFNCSMQFAVYTASSTVKKKKCCDMETFFIFFSITNLYLVQSVIIIIANYIKNLKTLQITKVSVTARTCIKRPFLS